MRHDLAYATRSFLRNPGFALAALLSLALGVGVTVAIFSVVNAVALRPLPYRDSERLVWLTEVLHGTSTDELTITPHFLEWRRQARSFASIAGYNYQRRNLTGSGDAIELDSARVSASLLPIIGVEPALGRNFTPHEDSKGNDKVIILTDSLWRARFSSDPNIVGRPILLDGLPFVVVGVLPKGFVFPGIDSVDLLTPLGKDEAELAYGPSLTIITNVIARLNPGASIREAEAELLVINSRLPRLPWTKKITIDMHPFRDHLYGNAKTAGWILLAAAGFLLWIACANVSNLLLARLTQRDREFAIRAVLGGSRGRLIAQLLTESAFLAALACALGTAVAFALRGSILALTPYKFAGFENLPFDWRVFSFAMILGIVTVLVFGVLPAFRATQGRLAGSIKSGEAAVVGGRGSARILSTLAAAEIATLLILSTGAGVTLKSFWKMRYQNLGISPDHLVTAEIVLSGPRYASRAQRHEFVDRLLDRAQSIPGVESVAVTNWSEIPPGFSHATNVFVIEGRPVVPMASGQRPIARFPQASPNLFAILQIPLLKGRLFDSSDRPEVAIINRALAEKYFPSENPLGRRVRFGSPDAPWFEIIGIVGDVKLSGLNAAAEPAIYYPESRENALGQVGLILKSPFDASSLAGEIRKTVAAIDPSQAVSAIQSLNTRLSESVSKPRFVAVLLCIFAALAGVLGIVGVYGVVACRVRWQIRELAVRQALGAQPGDVLRLVLSQGFAMIAAGIAAGSIGSVALSRLLATLVYQVRPSDPVTLITAAIVLAIVATAACWIPARRATRIDPLVLLRYE